MSDVAVVSGDPLLGSVDADPGVLLLLDDGRGGGVGKCRQGGRQGGCYLGIVNNACSQAFAIQGAGEVGGPRSCSCRQVPPPPQACCSPPPF